MSDWRSITLGDFVSMQRGHDLPSQTREDGNIPVMGSSGVTGYHSESKANGPGVIIGRSGASIGRISFVEGDYWPLNTCMYVTDFKGNDPKFVYSFLSTLNLAGHNSGSAQPSLNRNYIYPIEIEVPEPTEQREIAAILGALDDKIEVNCKASATLEAMARALYRSWFVDFDPVWAKLENRPPAHMPPQTAALFPDSFDDEGLPLGWELTTIGEIADIVGGGTPSTKQAEFWDDGHHLWATPKDLSNNQGPVLLNTERRITDLGLSKISSGLLPAGSLLLSSRAPIGYLVTTQRPVAINQGFIGIRETEMLSGIEAYHWCVENMELIHANANGSTFQEIAKKNFRPLPYVLAPLNVREAFNNQAGDYFARIAAFAEENQTLATLRDSLLPRLMSGELRVGDARAQVEEVA
jgi:type I restriction enzyme, S subunit